MAGGAEVSYSGLQVSPDRLSLLTDNELSSLFAELLRAQAQKTRVAASEAYVNAEDKAKDDGCDAWLGSPSEPDEWSGTGLTCWQLKAGAAGQPARLEGEVLKKIPKKTVADGGRFVVVASGSTNGKKGVDDRLEVILRDARAAGLPTENIDVYGSERLADWCNEHPAISWRIAGNTASVMTFAQWAAQEQHRVEWQASAEIERALEAIRRDLEIGSGHVVHLHVQGPPGVGKTRFALEACRGADWISDVVYVRQIADVDVGAIVQVVARNPRSRLVIVADEVQFAQLASLRDISEIAEGRVRLITIGHSGTPDPDRIPSVRIEPLEDAQMSTLVSAWHPGLPREHVDFIVRFADGYVRLARLAADAVARNPAGTVKDLLDQAHIRQFFDRMLGAADRRSLYVVAALSTVGWDEDLALEGRAIASHLGLSWADVQADVERFDRMFGIAPRGGRRRYISPIPLAAHLAVEAWATWPAAMRSLPDALPSDLAREAYFERIRTIASTPFARDFAREELRNFFDLAAFRKESDIKRWAALAAAAPRLAAKGVLAALQAVGVDCRLDIEGAVRRHMLSCLVEMASSAVTFPDASKAIALLGEAENETYANNASGEFCGFYQLHLGGTSAPYTLRLHVAEELLQGSSEAMQSLLVRALAQAFETNQTRIRTGNMFGERPEIEWRPSNRSERIECIAGSVRLLERVLSEASATTLAVLYEQAPKVAQNLWEDDVRTLGLPLLLKMAETNELGRKAIRKTLDRYLQNERKYWHRLSESVDAEIARAIRSISPEDFHSRLEREVGLAEWDKTDDAELRNLAVELASAPELITNVVGWLTSGEASDAWRFGEALADAGDLSSIVAVLLQNDVEIGPDARFVLAVVSKARSAFGEHWFDEWVDQEANKALLREQLIIESIWRLGGSDHALEVLGNILPKVSSASLHGLGFGTWYLERKRSSLIQFLWKLIEVGAIDVVLAIVDEVTKRDEGNDFEGLVDKLLSATVLIRSRNVMVEYHWKELALRQLNANPSQIVSAILKAHSDRSESSWFVEFSQVKDVLVAASVRYPLVFWNEARPYLEGATHGEVFTIGFPKGLFEFIPYEHIREWVLINPTERASVLASLVGPDYARDTSLSVQLLDEFGKYERVSEAFFGAYVSGSWMGSASQHWYELAEAIEKQAVGQKGYFGTWAQNTSDSLKEMAARERSREEEEHAMRRSR